MELFNVRLRTRTHILCPFNFVSALLNTRSCAHINEITPLLYLLYFCKKMVEQGLETSMNNYLIINYII